MNFATYNLKLRDFQPRNDTVFGILPSLYSIGRTPCRKSKQWNKLPKTRSPQGRKADFIKFLKEEARKMASQQEYAASMGLKWVSKPVTQVVKKANHKHVITPVKKVARELATSNIKLSIPFRYNNTKSATASLKDSYITSAKNGASSPSKPNTDCCRVRKSVTKKCSSEASRILAKEINDLIVDQSRTGAKNKEEKEEARKMEREWAQKQNQKHYGDLSDGEEYDDGSFNPSLVQAVKSRRRN